MNATRSHGSAAAPTRPGGTNAPIDGNAADGAAAGRLALRQVLVNGAMSGAAVGGPFGAAFATIHLVRALRPTAGGVAPLVLVGAGAASAYLEAAVRTGAQVRSTPLPPSRAYDAVAPVVFGGVNVAYTLSRLPKFMPSSPQGVAATFAVSTVSTFAAGATSEMLAQGLRGGALEGPPEPPAPGQTGRVAIGRAACMVPASLFGRRVSRVLREVDLTPLQRQGLSLRNTAVLAGSWAFRGVLAPGSEPQRAAAAEVDPARPRPPALPHELDQE